MDTESTSERELWERLPFVEGDVKAELLLDLCNQALDRKSAAEALTLAETAREIYESSGAYVAPSDVANAYQGIAEALRKLDRNQDAIEVMGKAIEILQELQDPYVDNLLRTKALWCNQVGDWEGALQSNLEAIRLNEIDGNAEWEANSWIGAGITYMNIGNYQESIKCLLRAREMFAEIQMVPHVGRCDIQLADAYRKAGDFENARSYGTKALHVAQLMQERVMMAWAYLRLGQASSKRGDFVIASGELEQAYYAAVRCYSYEMDWDLIIQIQSERAWVFRMTDRSFMAEEAEAQIQTITEIIHPEWLEGNQND